MVLEFGSEQKLIHPNYQILLKARKPRVDFNLIYILAGLAIVFLIATLSFISVTAAQDRFSFNAYGYLYGTMNFEDFRQMPGSIPMAGALEINMVRREVTMRGALISSAEFLRINPYFRTLGKQLPSPVLLRPDSVGDSIKSFVFYEQDTFPLTVMGTNYEIRLNISRFKGKYPSEMLFPFHIDFILIHPSLFNSVGSNQTLATFFRIVGDVTNFQRNIEVYAPSVQWKRQPRADILTFTKLKMFGPVISLFTIFGFILLLSLVFGKSLGNSEKDDVKGMMKRGLHRKYLYTTFLVEGFVYFLSISFSFISSFVADSVLTGMEIENLFWTAVTVSSVVSAIKIIAEILNLQNSSRSFLE
ncbi:MAG: hypothetical protein D6732_29370 [Methanobacteriota archaeon]|nr:MAG: hypothetical protein D6732_29370 [Euryarchaeota archaeon]